MNRNKNKSGARVKLKAVCSLLCLLIMLNSCAVLLTSCARRDELGNKYSEKHDGKEAANALVAEAKGKSDLISDIAYDVALMVKAEYGDETYNLGIKNSYFATDRGTAETEVFCSKTYYGSQGNQIDVYYRHDGHLYMDFCNTLIRSPLGEAEFYSYLDKQLNSASTSYFNSSSFADGVVYEYKDGTKAAVYSAPSEELKKSIAAFLGLEGYYVYEFSDMYLRCNVGVDGTVSDHRLDFVLRYHEEGEPDAVVVYDGEFACTVNAVGDAVSVRTPLTSQKYTTVTDISRLELLLKGYGVLASKTSIAADYYRKVQNEDLSGNKYLLSTEAEFTQKYENEVYTYGSIDKENGEIHKVIDAMSGEKDVTTSLTSVGVFIDAEGKYHYRDVNGKKEDKDREGSAEQWLNTFAATITAEAFVGDDLASLQITEEGDIITFVYEYSEDTLPIYATYLLDAFSAEQGGADIGNQKVTPAKNRGEVRIRISDGCLVYHKIEFAAIIGLSIEVSCEFELQINSTDPGEIDVLDLVDWGRHENRLN